jgi:hypothetical protein
MDPMMLMALGNLSQGMGQGMKPELVNKPLGYQEPQQGNSMMSDALGKLLQNPEILGSLMGGA